MERLKKVRNLSNLDEVANFLDIKPSTLRSRKSRGSIPYEEMILKLKAGEIGYVFKGAIHNTEQESSANEPINSYLQETSTAHYEHQVKEVITTIEHGPFSQALKIRLMNIVLSMVGEELNRIKTSSDSTADKKQDS